MHTKQLVCLLSATLLLFGGSLMPVMAHANAPDGVCCAEPSSNPVSDRTTNPAPTGAGSGDVVLDFEGLGDLEVIDAFYDGGLGGDGSGPGPAFGITFSSNAQAIIDEDAGGTGNFGGEPSPDTVLFFLSGSAATMNVPDGFTNGFSFFYSAINNPGQIVVYDGLDSTGNVLASLDLPLTPDTGAPDPNGAFSPLVPIGVDFSGTARSVDFGGTINQVAFDNITLGNSLPGGATPAPDPIAVPLDGLKWTIFMALALMIAGLVILRR